MLGNGDEDGEVEDTMDSVTVKGNRHHSLPPVALL